MEIRKDFVIFFGGLLFLFGGGRVNLFCFEMISIAGGAVPHFEADGVLVKVLFVYLFRLV